MPRKYKSTERFISPDPKFRSVLVQKFINSLMYGGKKATAQRVFYGAMEIIATRQKDVEPLEVFNGAIRNVKPMVEVRSRRVGGATYQVPKEVNKKRQQSLAIRWLLQSVRGRKGRPMAERLADELLAAYRHEGAAWTVRENVHRMAEANKAFAHFAW